MDGEHEMEPSRATRTEHALAEAVAEVSPQLTNSRTRSHET